MKSSLFNFKSKNYIYVVGDVFVSFSRQENVFTFSKFISLIQGEKNFAYGKTIIIGQGLSIYEKNILIAFSTLAQVNILNLDNFESINNKLTHKEKLKNSMITEPVKIVDEHIYCSWLFVDDDCAEMSDHVTGQHLQGMVLTEAARQMMLSVSEKFLLSPNDKENSYCVLLTMNSTFKEFAFPIETYIQHHILKLNTNGQGRYHAVSRTHIYQNDKEVAFVDIEYIFNNKNIMLEKENNLACSSVEESLALKEKSIKLKSAA